MQPNHGLIFYDSQFWVIHRRENYGPFDYEWSKDFCGLELMYQGAKFGEVCTKNELYADMKSLHLPTRVVEVSSIVMGCIVFGLFNGWSPEEREHHMLDKLTDMGYERFTQIERLDT